MLDIEYHTRFKRDYKLALKRGCEERLLSEVVEMLAAERRCLSDTETTALPSPKNMRE